MAMGVRLRNVRKSFGAVEVIHDVSMDIPKGDFAVFVGPSGCGKSTLLRMIAGLEETSGGTIEIDGRDVTTEEPSDRGVAMVFQNYALYPHLTVFDNMAFSLRLAKAKKDEIQEKVCEAARILQLEDHLQKRPSNLSGGQRQRVAIGRAIVRQPSVFLFDEPLSNLDAELRVEMRRELAQLHRQIGATMIYVTHDQVEAMTLADDIFVLKGGHVQQAGSPLSLYDNPDNRFVGGFIGSPAMNFLEAEVTGSEGAHVMVRTRVGDHDLKVAVDRRLDTGRQLTLGIRPEHLRLVEGGLRAKVDMAEQLGGVSYLHARLEDGGNVVVERHALREDFEGQTVGLTADPEHIYAFDLDGQRLR